MSDQAAALQALQVLLTAAVVMLRTASQGHLMSLAALC
jgi:hypothetical protein